MNHADEIPPPPPSEIGTVLNPDGEPRQLEGLSKADIGAKIKDLKQQLCHLAAENYDGSRFVFPGAHPVSLTREMLQQTLCRQRYYVCEKSDGVRYLLMADRDGDTYLVDRKCQFTKVDVQLQHRGERHRNTLLDGELISERSDDTEGEISTAFIMYDSLSIKGNSVVSLPLPDRLAAISSMVLMHGSKASKFSLRLKHMYDKSAVGFLWEEIVPKQRHGNDGLIFTAVDQPYTRGTDFSLIKWKPPQLNSVDFVVEVVRSGHIRAQKLYIGKDGRHVELFHPFKKWINLSENEMKAIDVKGGTCIVEAAWNFDGITENPPPPLSDGKKSKGAWKVLRIRDDKKDPNHVSVLETIWTSIQDHVLVKELQQSLS